MSHDLPNFRSFLHIFMDNVHVFVYKPKFLCVNPSFCLWIQVFVCKSKFLFVNPSFSIQMSTFLFRVSKLLLRGCSMSVPLATVLPCLRCSMSIIDTCHEARIHHAVLPSWCPGGFFGIFSFELRALVVAPITPSRTRPSCLS